MIGASIWFDAVNAGDLGRLLTLMADDVVFLNPGRPPFGRDGCRSPSPPRFPVSRRSDRRTRLGITSPLRSLADVPPNRGIGFPVGFSAGHQQSRIRCISELEEVVIVGEVAYTLCRDSLSVTPRAGGETRELAGHRITIYRKQPDGRWLLARDANTLSTVAS